MTGDPLITASLLGSARTPELPPAPDPALDAVWQAIPRDEPAAALLQALAITRSLHRAGVKPLAEAGLQAVPPCPPDECPPLPPAAIDSVRRLLAGEFSGLLPEWLRLASASGRKLPARVLPDFLSAATVNPALRDAVALLAGQRGVWLAGKYSEFSWLIESATVDQNAWQEGAPAERLAWLRQTRAADPGLAAGKIASEWKNEDAAMRESILHLVVEQAHACDEEWLENLALRDRRQEIRDLAAAALMGLPESGFRLRAVERAHRHVRIEGSVFKRLIRVEVPGAFDSSWAADGIKEKPPQGCGEKAWWLRQIIGMIPIDDWTSILNVSADELFTLPVEGDWRDVLHLGWIDSAKRLPARALPDAFLPFAASLDPWPSIVISKGQLIGTLLDVVEEGTRYQLLDRLLKELPVQAAIELIARVGAPPPPGEGLVMLEAIDAAVLTNSTALSRPLARSLAACIPLDGIGLRLEAISKLPGVSSATEEFATTLEFRRSMISQLTRP